ncbi:MAG: hypothetical protein OXF79_27650 [Chloroflexi bacterium]|nr:hypothetical protein [Chloroflexota bacterium]
MPAPRIVRVVVDGWTYTQRDSDNFAEARAMLSDAFASDSWPSRKATFAITPGGFIRTPLPRSYCGRRGWDSRKRDLDKLIPHAQAAVEAVMCGKVLKAARRHTRFLTLGVDLNGNRNKEDRLRGDHTCRRTCPASCTHAELVAVLDTKSGKVIHWTGKSNPTEEQQHSLVHVKNLDTHFVELGSDRVLLLGCHDLHLFSGRGRKSIGTPTPKENRRRGMHTRARKFKPTVILHHPHTTYSPYIWRGAWGGTRKRIPSAEVGASGIAFCGNSKPAKCWQTLKATRADTAFGDGISDIVICGYSRQPAGDDE